MPRQDVEDDGGSFSRQVRSRAVPGRSQWRLLGRFMASFTSAARRLYDGSLKPFRLVQIVWLAGESLIKFLRRHFESSDLFAKPRIRLLKFINYV